MRVFCPQHNNGFFTPRQTPIKCKSRGHILGELDFHGTAKTPVEIQWQYCCNCEHFSPIDFGQEGLKRCPVCTRRTSAVYLCHRCYTISFESNTPLQTKNFTLTSEGTPQPSCPGCLQEASVDLFEHACDELEAHFITALTSCPICLERLDVDPVFPSSVADYLRRTRARNKLNVTFDYDIEAFVPINDGEFVVISNSGMQPIVLPRPPRFASKRDFYELYQDYYHCTNVNVGEVHIIEPATVEATGEGWRFRSTGLLKVVGDQPKIKPHTNVSLEEETPVDEKQAPNTTVEEESSTAPCTNCGSLVETRYAFCWQCGKPMRPSGNASNKPSKLPPSLSRMTEEDDELPVEPNIGQIQQSILSSVPSWRRFAVEDESTLQPDSSPVQPSSVSEIRPRKRG